MRIGLAQSNLDNAHSYLMDVSDPHSPNFGKHYSAEEVAELFKPSDETLSVVRDWLESEGISNVVQSDNKVWLAFNAPAAKVEELLYTKYYEYKDSISGGHGRGSDLRDDWLVGEEFDVGPEFIRRQHEEESRWRRKCGPWSNVGNPNRTDLRWALRKMIMEQ